ncbi:MAG: hypothetical protein K0S65_6612 [Labilithrix sp.]|nr:hypothetical protein [Labilithrix sp.]
MMTGTVRVFTDKPTGAKLGGVETWEDLSAGYPRAKVRTWGLSGKILELQATPELEKENAEEIARLKQEVVDLAKKLEETQITLNLHSIPPEIKKGAKRAAREELGIRGKLNSEDPRFEDFIDEWDAQLLVRSVSTWVRAEDGHERNGISIENARSLKKYLEETEYAKISEKLNELLWTRQISQKAVEDADF